MICKSSIHGPVCIAILKLPEGNQRPFRSAPEMRNFNEDTERGFEVPIWAFAQNRWGVTLWLCQNSYWKWSFSSLIYIPILNGDFPVRYVSLPEGNMKGGLTPQSLTTLIFATLAHWNQALPHLWLSCEFEGPRHCKTAGIILYSNIF